MKLEDLAKLRKGGPVAKRGQVVVIDDDESVISSLKVVLKKHFDVIGCTDPLDGVKAALRPEVLVVIIDLKMPTYDGFWVYRKIRESGETVPIIFNSAYQDMKVPSEVDVLYRPFAYIQKNGRLNEFIETVVAASKTRI